MKKFVFALACLLAFTAGSAFADDLPTVVADPSGTYADLKKIVDRLDPQFEELLSFRDWSFFEGFSGSLYKLEKDGKELADLRVGYALDQIGYASVPVSLANLGQRYLPEKVNAFFESVPAPFKGKIAKYGYFGGWVGYNFDESEVDGGATFGLKFPLPEPK